MQYVKQITETNDMTVSTEKDKFKGQAVDENYAPVPTEKEAIEENLAKAGADNRARFGLDEQGLTK